MVEKTLPSSERQQTTHKVKKLQKMHKTWLVDGSHTPTSTIISTLAYGKKIARETGSRARIHWSEDHQTLYYCGQPILMEKFRRFMQDLTDEAENVLWNELMFAPIDGRFTMDLRSIKDNMMFT